LKNCQVGESAICSVFVYAHNPNFTQGGEYTHMGISLKVAINCQFLILWLFVRLFLAFSFRRFCLSLFK